MMILITASDDMIYKVKCISDNIDDNGSEYGEYELLLVYTMWWLYLVRFSWGFVWYVGDLLPFLVPNGYSLPIYSPSPLPQDPLRTALDPTAAATAVAHRISGFIIYLLWFSLNFSRLLCGVESVPMFNSELKLQFNKFTIIVVLWVPCVQYIYIGRKREIEREMSIV